MQAAWGDCSKGIDQRFTVQVLRALGLGIRSSETERSIAVTPPLNCPCRDLRPNLRIERGQKGLRVQFGSAYLFERTIQSPGGLTNLLPARPSTKICDLFRPALLGWQTRRRLSMMLSTDNIVDCLPKLAGHLLCVPSENRCPMSVQQNVAHSRFAAQKNGNAPL